jgi:hypothetical protein
MWKQSKRKNKRRGASSGGHHRPAGSADDPDDCDDDVKSMPLPVLITRVLKPQPHQVMLDKLHLSDKSSTRCRGG